MLGKIITLLNLKFPLILFFSFLLIGSLLLAFKEKPLQNIFFFILMNSFVGLVILILYFFIWLGLTGLNS